MDAAARLLAIWVRQSSARRQRIIADEATRQAIATVLWPSAVRWAG